VLVHRPSTVCPFREIDDFVKMGIDALGERATGVHLLAVLLRHPLSKSSSDLHCA